jgi:DnaK suppressor protein
MSQTPQQEHYSEADLAIFRALINEKLEEARSSFKDLQESLEEVQENSIHASSYDPEDASELSEKEYLLTMMTRQRRYIDNLESALTRIKNRSYGICRVTGKLIDKRRLLAVPHATTSIEGKNMEQQ